MQCPVSSNIFYWLPRNLIILFYLTGINRHKRYKLLNTLSEMYSFSIQYSMKSTASSMQFYGTFTKELIRIEGSNLGNFLMISNVVVGSYFINKYEYLAINSSNCFPSVTYFNLLTTLFKSSLAMWCCTTFSTSFFISANSMHQLNSPCGYNIYSTTSSLSSSK